MSFRPCNGSDPHDTLPTAFELQGVKCMILVDRCGFPALLACFAMLAPLAHPQAVAVAQVEGQVLDSSGAVVPSADVTMIEAARGIAHKTTSDPAGHYLLGNLPAGMYRLEAVAP